MDIVNILRDKILDIVYELVEEKKLEQPLNINSIVVERPKKQHQGDYSTNAAMVLGKMFSSKPKDLGEFIKLKLSDEDLLWLFNDSADETNALAELEVIARAEILIVTKGSQGSAIFHEKKWHEITSHPVEKLSDTVGAGDTFMASVLAWVMKKEKLNELALLELNEKKELLNYAAKAAALNCEKQGCNPPWENELL